jgi:hypothetical protein
VSGSLPSEDVARFLARCQTEWAAAGLPEKVTDPAVLDRIAAIVSSGAPAACPTRARQRITPEND